MRAACSTYEPAAKRSATHTVTKLQYVAHFPRELGNDTHLKAWTLRINNNGFLKNCRWLVFDRYTCFRLANPINPIRPELNNHAAAGTGTTVISRTSAWPVSGELSLSIARNSLRRM